MPQASMRGWRDGSVHRASTTLSHHSPLARLSDRNGEMHDQFAEAEWTRSESCECGLAPRTESLTSPETRH